MFTPNPLTKFHVPLTFHISQFPPPSNLYPKNSRFLLSQSDITLNFSHFHFSTAHHSRCSRTNNPQSSLKSTIGRHNRSSEDAIGYRNVVVGVGFHRLYSDGGQDSGGSLTRYRYLVIFCDSNHRFHYRWLESSSSPDCIYRAYWFASVGLIRNRSGIVFLYI